MSSKRTPVTSLPALQGEMEQSAQDLASLTNKEEPKEPKEVASLLKSIRKEHEVFQELAKKLSERLRTQGSVSEAKEVEGGEDPSRSG